MFLIDLLRLEKDLDSLADQIINLDGDQCKLTRTLRPQLGLKVKPNFSTMWQSAYLRENVSKPFADILE